MGVPDTPQLYLRGIKLAVSDIADVVLAAISDKVTISVLAALCLTEKIRKPTGFVDDHSKPIDAH